MLLLRVCADLASGKVSRNVSRNGEAATYAFLFVGPRWARGSAFVPLLCQLRPCSHCPEREQLLESAFEDSPGQAFRGALETPSRVERLSLESSRSRTYIHLDAPIRL